MMNINAANSTQRNWPEAPKWPTIGDKEPIAVADTQKLKEDIEKEEKEIQRITQEFSEHLSKGEQDMAKLKGVELAQKQMQVQSLRGQIEKLEKPEQSSDSASVVTNEPAISGRPKYDQFVNSGSQTEEAPGLYRLESDEDGNQKIVFASLTE